MLARDEVEAARKLLPQVQIPEAVTQQALGLIKRFEIDSLRAEITLFEAAKALAAADARSEVTLDDIRLLAPMTLRLRRSAFIREYFNKQSSEEDEIASAVGNLTEE